jgi:N-acetylglucosamine malate deacetylase 1
MTMNKADQQRPGHTSDGVDIVCFGAHADDVEIGMGGTVRKLTEMNVTVSIVDLTQAELSSNGTVEQRALEADRAAELLVVKERLNLGFPDRGLQIAPHTVGPIVNILRTYKPRYVFAPVDTDRHPDHRTAATIVEEAVFSANIRKYDWQDQRLPAHQVQHVLYYFFNEFEKPDVLWDISETFVTKQQALLAYTSQFKPSGEGVATRLNTGFTEAIEGRDRLFGKMADVPFAEGFKSKRPLLVDALHPFFPTVAHD